MRDAPQSFTVGQVATYPQPGLPQTVPSRPVLDAVRLLARPAISRGLWWRLEGPLDKAGVEFTNGLGGLSAG